MYYRKEIEGLRAIALFSVILYHAGFKSFSGGYVGVDVFFVISGYFITLSIFNDLLIEKFSIFEFYIRRARRILPLLSFVVLICIPFAWFLLLPVEIRDFAQSLIAVSFFATNFLFWRESGYFYSEAELKPLLHTWSLAVELQFYLIFPLFFIFIWKHANKYIIEVFLFIIAVSLFYAQFKLVDNLSSAFYLFPSRCWEFFVGSISALISSKHIYKRFGTHLIGYLDWVGILMVFYSIFFFSNKTLFPALNALIPTIGTALILIFSSKETTVGKLIGNKFFVYFGLISYSAYLWHQPLFAFVRHYSLSQPSQYVFLLLSILIFIFSYFSWKFIEVPLRVGGFLTNKQFFFIYFIVSSFILLFGILGHFYSDVVTDFKFKSSNNLKSNYELLKFSQDLSPVFNDENRFDNNDCKFNVPNLTSIISDRLVDCRRKYGSGILVIGDSHATNFYHSIIRNKNNVSYNFIVGITKNGCHLPTDREDCPYAQVFKFIKNKPDFFSYIIYEKAGYLLMNWNSERHRLRDPYFVSNASFNNNLLLGIEIYLNSLVDYSNVIWFGPRFEPLVTEREFLRSGCLSDFVPTIQHKNTFASLDIRLKEFSKNKRWKYVSQLQLVNFNFPADFGNCNHLFWIDSNHFSIYGEEYFGSRYILADLIK